MGRGKVVSFNGFDNGFKAAIFGSQRLLLYLEGDSNEEKVIHWFSG